MYAIGFIFGDAAPARTRASDPYVGSAIRSRVENACFYLYGKYFFAATKCLS
jgi:hypothetical protein